MSEQTVINKIETTILFFFQYKTRENTMISDEELLEQLNDDTIDKIVLIYVDRPSKVGGGKAFELVYDKQDNMLKMNYIGYALHWCPTIPINEINVLKYNGRGADIHKYYDINYVDQNGAIFTVFDHGEHMNMYNALQFLKKNGWKHPVIEYWKETCNVLLK